jgi:DNA-binding response OmpR family regulator
MRILIADDDEVGRTALDALLRKWGHTTIAARDGQEAWRILETEVAPEVAIIDWMMPVLDGIELIRRIRGSPRLRSLYIILLTARDSREQMIAGLDAGANDYVTKPFDPAELRARVGVGTRVAALQGELAARVCELEAALAREHKLAGLLPICSYCKKVRDDQAYWHEVEEYLTGHSDVQFSHGVCPACYGKVVRPEIDRYRRSLEQKRARQAESPPPPAGEG